MAILDTISTFLFGSGEGSSNWENLNSEQKKVLINKGITKRVYNAPIQETGIPKSGLAAIAKAAKALGGKPSAVAKNLGKAKSKTPKTRVTEGAGKTPKKAKAKKAPAKKKASNEKITEEAKKQARRRKAVKKVTRPAKKAKSKKPNTETTRGMALSKSKAKVKKAKNKIDKGRAATAVATAGVGALTPTKDEAAKRNDGILSRWRQEGRALRGKMKQQRKLKKDEVLKKAMDSGKTTTPRGIEKPKVDSSVIKEREPENDEAAKKAKTDAMTFGQAFRLHKNEGKEQFEWRGRQFHTRTKDEEKKAKDEVLKKAMDSGKTTTPRGIEKPKIDSSVIKEREPEKKKRVRRKGGKPGPRFLNRRYGQGL